VSAGIGNGGGDGTEGAVAGRIVGTYLHGPVLARNPALADLLLGWALGATELAPLDDAAAESLRAERLAASNRRRFRRRR
jgi:lipid II isoglutaminyl synthase (glutamine-hydrolysing)